MPQQSHELERHAGRPGATTARALRALGVLAMVAALGTMLAGCGRCGDFLSSSLGQIGACHSDSPAKQ